MNIKAILQTNRVKLVENIDGGAQLAEICDHLKGTDPVILSDGMWNEIQGIKENKGKVRKLLDLLPKRGPTALIEFYNALVSGGHESAATYLAPYFPGISIPMENPGELPTITVPSSHNSVQVTRPEDETLPSYQWPNPELIKKNLSSGNLKKLQEEEFQKIIKEKSGSFYPFRNKEKGRFLLIVNKEFQCDHESEGGTCIARHCRQARSRVHHCENDNAGLYTVFCTELGLKKHANPRKLLNKSAQEIRDLLLKESQVNYADCDCFVLAILSCGTGNSVYGSDWEKLTFKEIQEFFSDENCPSLAGKPKLIFLQVCPVIPEDCPCEKLAGMSITDAVLESPVKTRLQSTAETPAGCNDMIMVAAEICSQPASAAAAGGGTPVQSSETVDLLTSVLDLKDVEGTWFVQAILTIFLENAYNKHLMELLKMVDALLMKTQTSRGAQRVAEVKIITNTLNKDFYFFPGYSSVDAAPSSGSTVGGKPVCGPTEDISLSMLSHEICSQPASAAATGGGTPIQSSESVGFVDWPQQKHFHSNTSWDMFKTCQATDSELITQKSDSFYPLYQKYKGKFLLIFNKDFTIGEECYPSQKNQIQERIDHSEADTAGLTRMFKEYGFKTVPTKKNLTAQKIRDLLMQESKKVHHEFDCFVLVILSYGATDAVYGTDWQKVTFEEIQNAFSDANCPSLKGKPKLIFIQACSVDPQFKLPEKLAEAGLSEASATMECNDMFMASGVSESGPKSLVDLKGFAGTWFIQALLSVFQEHSNRHSLQKMLTMVNSLLNKAKAAEGFRKVAEVKIIVDTLKKQFYFFPGRKPPSLGSSLTGKPVSQPSE